MLQIYPYPTQVYPKKFPLSGPSELCKINKISGFTLIEVLIAIVVLSVALLGLASIAVVALNSTHYSKMRTTAIALAQDKMEDLKRIGITTPLSSDNNGTEEALDASGDVGEGFFTRSVTITGGDGQLTTISVNVAWRDFAQHAIVQTTIISQ